MRGTGGRGGLLDTQLGVSVMVLDGRVMFGDGGGGRRSRGLIAMVDGHHGGLDGRQSARRLHAQSLRVGVEEAGQIVHNVLRIRQKDVVMRKVGLVHVGGRSAGFVLI